MPEQENRHEEQAAAAMQPEQTKKNVGNQQAQGRPCPKDCTKCGYQQHAFCAARMSFQMFEVMNGIIQRLDIQSQRLADLEAKIAAIQSAEAEFSSPLPMEGDLFAGTE